jgi:hypothetical protein
VPAEPDLYEQFREAASEHEIAHGVVSARLGIRVKAVSLEQWRGSCDFDVVLDTADKVERHATALIAGAIWEMHKYGVTKFTNPRHDYAAVGRLANNKDFLSDSDAFLARISARAKALVIENAEIIERLAAKLRAAGTTSAAVDLSRLNAGAPLLASHDSSNLNSIIGVVSNARIENAMGLARIRLSQRPEVASVVQDVRDGVLLHVSVGYKVISAERINRAGDIPTLRVTRWQPMELKSRGDSGRSVCAS